MKIGLMGCEFLSPNKGCEALTYSIISILNKLDCIENSSIIYNFSGTELGTIEKEFPKFKFINMKPKLKDITFKYFKALHSCNIIFDATMGDSFSDIYSKSYYNHLIHHKKIAEILCKNYILLPQTYGPFSDEKSEKSARGVFKKALKIYCRDEMSKKMLEDKFNIKNSELTSDMAFILPYKKDLYKFKKSNKKKIGINVSGLLYKGGFEKNNQFGLKINYKDFINKLIEYLNNNNYEVHLISHVIDLSDNAHDDDYKVCESLQKKYNKCILSPIFNNPIEAKSYISNMDYFIGSRMHATIASFSSNVITIPISYSRKFEGLFNSLNYKYVINGKNEDVDSALKKVKEYLNNADKLKEQQDRSLKIIDEKCNSFIKSIENEIEKISR